MAALGGDVAIDNSGTIDGNVSIDRIGGDVVFGNSGDIAGNAAAKNVQGSVTFINSGTISNQVQLQDIGGDLLLDNSGDIANNQVRIQRVSGDISLNNSGTIQRLFINQPGSQGGDLSISNAAGGLIERFQNFNNLSRVDTEFDSDTAVDGDITTTIDSTTSEVVGGHFSLTNAGTIGAAGMNDVGVMVSNAIEGTGLDVDNAGGDIVIENTATGEIFFKKPVTLRSRTTLADVETTTVVDDSGDDTVTTVTSVFTERTVGGHVSLINAGLIQDETATGNDIQLRAAGNVLLENSGTIDYTVAPCCQDIILSAGGIEEVGTFVGVDGMTVSESRQQSLVAGDVTFINSGTVNVTALIGTSATGNVVLENTDQGMINYNDFWGAFANAQLFASEFSAAVDDDGVVTETFMARSEAAGGELSLINAGSLQTAHAGSMGVGADGGLSFNNSGVIGAAANPLVSVFLTAGERESESARIEVFGAGASAVFLEGVNSFRVSDLAFDNSGALWAGSLSLAATGNVMATNNGTLGLGGKTLNIDAGSIDRANTSAFSSEMEEESEDDVTTSVLTSTTMITFAEAVVSGNASLVNGSGAMVSGPVSIKATSGATLDNAGTLALGNGNLDVRAGTILDSSSEQGSSVTTIVTDDDLNAPLFESEQASFSVSTQQMAATGSIDFVNRAGGEITCSMGCAGDVNLNAVGNVSFRNFGSIEGDVKIDNIAVLTATSSDDFESSETSFERFDSNDDGDEDATRPTERILVRRSSSTVTQELAQGEVSINNQGTIAGAIVRDLVVLSNSSSSTAQTTTTVFEEGEATRRTTEFEAQASSKDTDAGGHGGGTTTNEANASIGRVDIDTTEDAGLDNLGTVIGNVRINTIGATGSTSESESSRFVQDLRSPPTPVRSFFMDVDGSLIAPASSHPGPRFVLEDPDGAQGGLPGFLGSDADLDPNDGPFVEAFFEKTFESTFTDVGGNASLNNVSFDSIGGNAVIFGLNEASANNAGLIRGDVAINAGSSASVSVDTDSFERLAPTIDPDAGTVTVVDTLAASSSDSSSVIVGSATLDNSGTIGEFTIDQGGNIDIDGGKVDVSATGTAAVNNTPTGLIYGTVSVMAGGTESALTESGTWEHQTVINADTGDLLSRVGSFSGQRNATETSVAASATVVNEGEIGRQLIQSNGIAVSNVGTRTVLVRGSDASVINTGSILSGVLVQGMGVSFESAATLDIDFNSVTDENGVTTQTVVDVETGSVTEGGIGATALLENAGTIGGLDLGRSMSVVVIGQAEATLENTGAITGSDVFSSFIEVVARDTVTSLERTEAFEQTQVGGMPVVSETLADTLDTTTEVGGAALLDNAGNITVDNIAVIGAPAMLINSGTLSTGVVTLNSQFRNFSEQTVTTNTMSATGPTLLATRRDDSMTTTGGVASLGNTGTLNASIVLEGFEAATLVNAANAAINGNVTAIARGTDTTFESDTVFRAGEQTGSFTRTATQVGGVASVANAGTINGSVTANGFAGSEVNNAVTGLIIGGVELGGNQSSYVNTVNENGALTQTPAGPDLGENGTETVLSNAGVIQGSVNAQAFNLNTIDNSGQMGSLTVSAFGSSNEIVNSGVIMGSIHANAGDTDILNTGIITGSVNFNAPGSVNTLTMASGAHITSGSITAAIHPTTGENVTSTGIELQGLGLFSGNVSGVNALTRSGEGTWVLTGSGSSGLNPTTATYDIAEIDIVSGGMQFGGGFGQAGPTPGTPFMQPGFLAGNTALDPRFLDVVNDTLAGADRFGTNSVINVEGNINVGEAGALSGEFALFGNLEVAGTFTPGFITTRSNPRTAGSDELPFIAPGQVQIEGDYTLAGGTHAIGFGPELRSVGSGAARFDGTFGPNVNLVAGGLFAEETLGTNLTTVSGDANLGSTLSVLVETGLYVDGQRAEFLRVTGELNADGLSVSPTANPRFVNFGVTTSEDEGVTVASITATRDSFTTAAGSENEAAAAGALDVSVADVVSTLRTADRDSDAFRTATMLGRVITQLDFGGLSDDQVRATFGDFAPGFLASLNSLDVSRPVLSSTMRRASGRLVAAEQEPGISGWAEGHLLNDRMDGAGGAAGIQADFHGISAGIEARGVDSLIGLAFGYSDISVKGRGNTDRADVEAKTLGLYSGYRNGPFTVNGQAGFTWSNFETRRALGGMLPGVISGLAGASVATADYDSTEWNVSAQVAYDFILDNGVTVSPLAELRYRNRSVDSIREEVGGVALLDIDGNSGSMWIPTIGVEASTEMSFGDWSVRPTGGLRYAFVPGSDEEIDVRLIGTNAVYETQGAQMDNQLILNAGVSLDRNNLSIFGGTNVGFTGDQRTFQFNAGLRYRF